MNVLYLDPFSGISGDMVLGLLADLGVDMGALESELRRLPVHGWRLEIGRERRMGIVGTRVQVLCEETHHHRTWAGIDALLAESSLPPPAVDLARRMFRRLGEAEARVHGVPLESVHFHEVGAVDSIVDVAGAALGFHALEAQSIVCAPLPLARGMVDTAHGRYPLPAPATAEVLRGLPVTDGACDQELVTPTGATIAATAARFGSLPEMELERIGYGVGGRHLPDRPNLLRGMLGRLRTAPKEEEDSASVLETHLDDANPEWLGALLEKLLEEGALDAAYSPLQMKKNRPGVRVTVVSTPEDAPRLIRVLLRESSAIGVRRYETRRTKLRREARTVTTPAGKAEIKLLYQGNELLRITPEYESCRRLARESGRPLPEIYRLVERASEGLLNH